METNVAGASSRMLRSSPAFCFTFVPGSSTLPFAERVIFATSSASVAMMPNPSTNLVD